MNFDLPIDLTALNASWQIEPWIQKISDDKLISEMTIPGTHDTCCNIIYPFCQTQSMDLHTQLRAGIRFLDIRCRHLNNLFAIHHGLIFCNMTFGEVLKDCEKFLLNNPNEFIVMRVQ